MPAETIEDLEKKFATAARSWGGLAQRSAQTQGNPAAAQAIEALTQSLLKLLSRLWEKIKDMIKDLNPFPVETPVSVFVDAAIDDMLDTLIKVLDDMANMGAAALDAAVAGVMGLFEAIKKAIHLIMDQVKIPGVTEAIELLLDLINNVMGNIAELVSRAAGKLATTFRTNMYGQLAAARAARGAKADAFIEDDSPDGR